MYAVWCVVTLIKLLSSSSSSSWILWVVRCFIGAIFGHSQVPGPLRGLEIPANEFSLCDSSLEQGLTLLTQLVKLLHPLCRRLYRQLLG